MRNEKDQGDPMSVGSSNSGSGREILELERDQLVVELCRPKQPRLRVLVVEDEPDAQTLLKFILEPQYEVITASSGEEMRRQLEAHPERVSLVLMDLKLEGDEDGVTLTKHLRNESRWKGIPIVALTAARPAMICAVRSRPDATTMSPSRSTASSSRRWSNGH